VKTASLGVLEGRTSLLFEEVGLKTVLGIDIDTDIDIRR